MKKCPACGSSRFRKWEFRGRLIQGCEKCGFENVRKLKTPLEGLKNYLGCM